MRSTPLHLGAAAALSSLFLGITSCGDEADDGQAQPPTDPPAAGGSLGTGGEGQGAQGSGGSAGSGSTAALGGASATGGAGGSTSQPIQQHFVFVGSREDAEAPTAVPELRAYRASNTDGSLTPAGSIDAGDITFFDLGPPQDGSVTLYTAEWDNVHAFEYDLDSETFRLAHDQETFGLGAHIETDPTGEHVFVANFNQGTLSLFDYDSETGFGPEQLYSPGTQPHQVRLRGNDVYVPCAGDDTIAHYDWDGALAPASPPTSAATGYPRHMDFHPTLAVAYILAQMGSVVHVYDIATNGTLNQRPSSSVFTHEDEGDHKSSDVKVHPSGKFLYAGNRDAPEIVLMQIAEDGSLTRDAAVPVSDEARSFGMAPGGLYLYVGTADGVLQPYAIDQTDGTLSAAGAPLSGLGRIFHVEALSF